jgi:hypothetical protein
MLKLSNLIRSLSLRNISNNYQSEYLGAGSLFAQVGLHPSAPDFVIEAVRKAYRMHYHPDKYSANEKKAAEETFKEVDKIFDRIKELKG